MPRPEPIADFSELYQRMVGGRALLSGFLPGHLAVEFLLRKLVGQYDPKLTSLADDFNHARLIALNAAIGTITEPQREVLVLLNGMRNKLAHSITYDPPVEELRTLWGKASRAFDDLTDGISQGMEALETAASTDRLDEWVIPELFVQITYDLHAEYVDRGGDQEEF